MFHMKRTAGTLVLQSLLPLTYLATVSYFTVVLDNHYPSFTAFWDTYPVMYNILAVSILLPTLTLTLLWYWSLDNWANHPMVRQLRLYAREGNWRQVAADIETEFRRIDKISLRSSPLTRLVAFMGLHGDQGKDQAGQAFPGDGGAGAVGQARAGRRDEGE